ncbi:Undecaprenyl-phosphate alpha-N-acetylglucosaminyl 1-phosphate transferase [Ferriphaselus amnicola]|uniref:Undecaprenyl-phosphate alpha-N-acetylglucosaminyl 1-phosphate transferase n=1 Tax=Ferriphaselus amnicola TaxID=1188319 RepID=A0A2Z6G9Y6_9PROT|nr:MraY family glycosyltransferase [Ferriphaselus amnicola]BBE50263.1 Undecaprenyl-phosphate alpha-N-acetylglucosaminyl 1-phosphate transferase [Ferriphaselus amnicola]
MSLSIFFLGSLFACVMWVYVLTPVACRIRLIDKPNERKQHRGEIPLIGGIAIFLALIPAMFSQWAAGVDAILIWAVSALLLVGALDDRFHLSAKLRLAIQVLIVGVVFSSGTSIHGLGNIFGMGAIELHGVIDFVITAIVVLGIINAVNMVDGVDGLAGSLMLVAVAGMVGLAVWTGHLEKLPILISLAGALIGFLGFNLRHGFRQHAAIFLGDSGSMFIGILLVILMLRLLDASAGQIKPITMIWLLAVPLLDMCAVIFRRLSQGDSPLVADRNHIHHILLRRGYSTNQVVGALFATAVFFAATAIVCNMYGVPEWFMFVLFWLGVVSVALCLRESKA